MAAGTRIAGLGLLLAVLACAPARADSTYTVYYCRGPAGQPASTDGLTAVDAAKAPLAGACPGGALSAGPPTGTFTTLQAVGIVYRVPPGTRLTSYTLYRTVALNNYFNWSLIEDPDTHGALRETCWTMASTPCSGLGDGQVSNASVVGHEGIDTGGLALWIDCNPGPCSGDGARPRVALHRLDAVLADRSDPVFTSPPAGDLLETSRPVSGVGSVSYSASDVGGGLYQASLEVDGKTMLTQLVDENGGRCRLPFLAPVPCLTTATGKLSFDTAALADGPHSVRLVLTDATQTNSARPRRRRRSRPPT